MGLINQSVIIRATPAETLEDPILVTREEIKGLLGERDSPQATNKTPTKREIMI